MADDPAPLGVRFTFLDYIALGFILEGTIVFLHQGENGWKIWAPGFALGLVCLAFRNKSPRLTARLLGWFRAPKKLDAAIAENVELKRQLGSKSETTRPQRLKIIEAHYGVEGINNPDVTQYLLERLREDSYAELVGADLFHGFDPLPGNPNKKLTVRYSFDGREMGIVRPEHEWLILPEDMFLRKLLDECHRSNAQVSKAVSSVMADRLHAEAERDEIRNKLDAFIPLQFEAIELSRDLLRFAETMGPPPWPRYTREQLKAISRTRAQEFIANGNKDYEISCLFWLGEISDDPSRFVATVDSETDAGVERCKYQEPWKRKIEGAFAEEKFPERPWGSRKSGHLGSPEKRPL